MLPGAMLELFWIVFAAGCAGRAGQLACMHTVAHAMNIVMYCCIPQCFDTTAASEARAGAHEALHMEPKELPRWSKALTQYR
jgi:hypothetical protein